MIMNNNNLDITCVKKVPLLLLFNNAPLVVLKLRGYQRQSILYFKVISVRIDILHIHNNIIILLLPEVAILQGSELLLIHQM
jgi:hypothetical protein